MGVIQGFHASAGSTPAGDRLLDRASVELFVRAQGSWMRQGLRRACDRAAVGMVLATHDTAHPSWLGLIAAVEESLGSGPAKALAALYALHGRVAGVLERGPDPRLSPDISAAVRGLLEARLGELTDAAVAGLGS